ncbi:MAG: YihY/virulence factor BrkB family protein [Bacteroidales bacterium]|nr:YihY/virulence factor BrkB family protein [Bacteroidales bacterium]
METKFLRKFIYWRPVRNILHASRMVVVPGFQGIPLFDVAVFFVKGLIRGVLNQRAAATSFHFILALFPLILFLFTLLPYFDTTYYAMQLFDFLKEMVPSSIYPTIKSTLNEILSRKHTGLLSVGFVTSIFVASNGINAILISFNQTHHTIEKRRWLKRRLMSILIVVLIPIVLIISFTLTGGFKLLVNYLVQEGFLYSEISILMLKIAKWIVLIGIVYLAFASLYYYTPASRTHYTFFSAGATLATFLFLLTTQGFNFYIIHFSQYNALYGSIGALIIVLLWIYLNSYILLIGFELNASIAEAHILKAKESNDDLPKLNRTSRTLSPIKRWKKWKRRRQLLRLQKQNKETIS